MTEPPPAVGTVAQEVARLLEEMATMAHSGASPAEGLRPYRGVPVQEPPPQKAPPAAPPSEDGGEDWELPDEPSAGPCSVCGGEGAKTPASCRICPVCRGIALLRAIRPETVDLLADLAVAMAASLRDVASRSRAADPAPPGASRQAGTPAGSRGPVQDIPVDDENEGSP
jgi:hypothetical protein